MSEEVQVQGSLLNSNLDYTVGYFYFEQRITQLSVSSVLGLPSSAVQGKSVARSNAVYAQGTYGLADKLSLTAGFRYTWDYRSVRLDGNTEFNPQQCFLSGVDGTPFPADANCALNVRKSFATPTWTLSLNYQADPATLIYVAHRRGYRAGGSSLYATSVSTAIPFKPEKVTDIELGFKRDWDLGGTASLRTNAAVFYSDYKDIIRNFNPPGNANLIILTNATNAKIYGGEVETTLRPFDGLVLTANAAYVHAKFGKFVTAKGDATGYPLANVPRLQLTGGARYTFPRSDLGEISIGGDVFYQSKVWYDDVAQDPAVFGPISSLRQKGYALVSLRLDWEGILNSALDGSIYVTNLTKTKYRTSTQTQLFDGFGYNTQFPGEPRVFGAELRYKF